MVALAGVVAGEVAYEVVASMTMGLAGGSCRCGGRRCGTLVLHTQTAPERTQVAFTASLD